MWGDMAKTLLRAAMIKQKWYERKRERWVKPLREAEKIKDAKRRKENEG